MITLRVYSAWVAEADQWASQALFSRVPDRPDGPVRAEERAKTALKSPYERIAFDIRSRIAVGELTDGDAIPTLKKLMADYGVAAGTANRAVSLLKTWGLVVASPGRPTVVADGAAELLAAEAVPQQAPPATTTEAETSAEPATPDHQEPAESGTQLLRFEARHLGKPVRTFTAEADSSNPDHLRRLLTAAVHRDGRDPSKIIDYGLDVRRPDGEHLTTFVSMPL